jgi:hypothetical protein
MREAEIAALHPTGHEHIQAEHLDGKADCEEYVEQV